MRTLSVAVVLMALAFPGQTAVAQSLGDLAKQQAEQRKAAKEPKVLTNKDVPVVPQTAPAANVPADAAASSDAQAAPASADAKASSDSGATADKDAPKDEKYWRGRKKGLEDQLARDQTLLDALQSRINALSTDFVNRDDPAQRAVIATDRQKAVDEIARLNKAIIADKQMLTDLEDEARRANVPAGWLR